VLLAIVRLTYGFQKASARISLSNLAKRTRLDRRTATRAIHALGDLIKIERDRKGQANEYALNLNISTGALLAGAWEEVGAERPLGHRAKGRDLEAPRTRGSEPSKVGGEMPPILNPHLKPNASKPKATDASSLSSTKNGEDKVRPSKKPKRHVRNGSRNGSRDVDPSSKAAFDKFYQAYPKHLGYEDAFKEWLQIDPDLEISAQIIEGAEAYSKHVKEQRIPWRYILTPANWLKRKRWSDEYEEAKEEGPNGPEGLLRAGIDYPSVRKVKSTAVRF
jgi:hypothetical protein